MITEDTLRQALCDVRKAHRIIYAYQQRMTDIALFIRRKLDYPDCAPAKLFSDPMHRHIDSRTWAWDFIYTYLLNYYIGEKEENGRAHCMSIIQYSDTGYFDVSGNSRTDILSFAPEEEAESKLMFIIEGKPRESSWWWPLRDIVGNKEYASRSHTSTVLRNGDSTIGICSVPIARFIDEQSSLTVLRDFCRFCSDNGIAPLTIH